MWSNTKAKLRANFRSCSFSCWEPGNRKKKPCSWKDGIFLKCCCVSSLSSNCPSTEELNVRLQSSWQTRRRRRLGPKPTKAPYFTASATVIMRLPLRRSREDGCIYFLELFSLLGGQKTPHPPYFQYDRDLCFHPEDTFSSSLECPRHTHWPRLVKQHAAICLPPVKNAPTLASFFLPCRPSMSSFIMFLWARPRLLTQTRCNLFNPPLSWADKAWPPSTLLHLTQPGGTGFFASSPRWAADAYRSGGFDLK